MPFDPSQPFDLIEQSGEDVRPSQPQVPAFDPTQSFEIVEQNATQPANESQTTGRTLPSAGQIAQSFVPAPVQMAYQAYVKPYFEAISSDTLGQPMESEAERAERIATETQLTGKPQALEEQVAPYFIGGGAIKGLGAGEGLGAGVGAAVSDATAMASAEAAKQSMTPEFREANPIAAAAIEMAAAGVGGSAVMLPSAALSVLSKVKGSASVEQLNTLIKDLGLDQAQADEMYRRYTNITGETLTTPQEKMLALAETQVVDEKTGMILQAVAKDNPAVATMIKGRARKRAEAIKKRIGSTEDVIKVVRDDIKKYYDNVSEQYRTVKRAGIEIAGDQRFRINEEMGEMLKDAQEIVGQDMSGKTVNMVKKWSARDVSFGEFLQFRKNFNDFWSANAGKIEGNPIFDVMEDMKSQIDSTIEASVANRPGGKEWFSEFQKANADYSDMLTFTENKALEAINKVGNEKSQSVMNGVVNALIKTDPNAVAEVMKRVTPQSRTKLERAIVENLVVDPSKPNQGLNFPEIARKMNEFEFTTPEGVEMKALVNKMAEVFKTDQVLAKMSAKYKSEADGMVFANSLYGKAEMSIINKTWKTMTQAIKKQATGGERERLIRADAIDNLSSILQNPRGSGIRDIEELISSIGVTNPQEVKTLRTSLFGILRRLKRGEKEFLKKQAEQERALERAIGSQKLIDYRASARSQESAIPAEDTVGKQAAERLRNLTELGKAPGSISRDVEVLSPNIAGLLPKPKGEVIDVEPILQKTARSKLTPETAKIYNERMTEITSKMDSIEALKYRLKQIPKSGKSKAQRKKDATDARQKIRQLEAEIVTLRKKLPKTY